MRHFFLFCIIIDTFVIDLEFCLLTWAGTFVKLETIFA